MSNTKKRNWAFVVYPDSAPPDWIDKLQQTGLQCAISPLHDADLNADESEKKPHWHVIAVYSQGCTTFNVVKRLTDSLNAPIPIALEQVRGYYRYLTHRDNPEKTQYDEKDIRTINGFNITDYIELTKSEVSAIKKKLQSLIRANEIMEYCDLIDFLEDNELSNEHDVASNHTIYFNTYITSRRNKRKEQNADASNRRPPPLTEEEIKRLNDNTD